MLYNTLCSLSNLLDASRAMQLVNQQAANTEQLLEALSLNHIQSKPTPNSGTRNGHLQSSQTVLSHQ